MTKERNGDTLRLADCESCQDRGACQVDDCLVAVWKGWGTPCPHYAPKTVYRFGNCAT